MLTAGNPVTKQTVDQAFGGLANKLSEMELGAARANGWLASASDADLTGFGYSSDDIAALRACAVAAELLAQIYQGSVNLADPFDFKSAIQALAGLG